MILAREELAGLPLTLHKARDGLGLPIEHAYHPAGCRDFAGYCIAPDCTARGLVTATTVGSGWGRPDAHGPLPGGTRWARAIEAARRIRDGLAASASVSWSQAHRSAHAATREALGRAGLICMSASEDLEPLWAAHRDGTMLTTMRQSICGERASHSRRGVPTGTA